MADYYDAVVIGGGFSGIAAALRLAQAGRRVLLLERQERLGGLNTWYPRNERIVEAGLHALTNWFDPAGRVSRPWQRIFRQLRIRPETLRLCPQHYCRVEFPQARLEFANGTEAFLDACRKIPGGDSVAKLLERIANYDDADLASKQSARQVLEQVLGNTELVELLLSPTCYYGSPIPGDMPWGLFCVLFRSIFLEGLCRPQGGIKALLDILQQRLQKLAVEVRTGCKVTALVTNGSKVGRILFEDGSDAKAEWVVSSIGGPETVQLLKGAIAKPPVTPGRISLVELILELDRPPCELGMDASILFFNRSTSLEYRTAGLVNLQSGVICSPGNFACATDAQDRALRITALADFHAWHTLSRDAYRHAKLECFRKMLEVAEQYVPGLSQVVVNWEMATPLTIYRYTGRLNGAVYGSPDKQPLGQTSLQNLVLTGTDCGLVGVVGALVSGIQTANRLILK